ncbi:GNAT family N-acetyltransferase [Acidisphaera sp. L21]|uniref:GNAT family N-acetyltransferase n=1 Tax=Acidisphaera sp. L21 TaxID=1641851 RepID=UPI00131C4D28|nr:GNAT family N-acetyltransferase [Acidisphaera sp. L21]
MSSGLRYGVEIRAAQPADAAEIARLLVSAGVVITAREVTDRLEATRTRPESTTLVATGYGGLSGVVALEWAPSLHQARPAARIGVLVVDAGERRHGIGRLLLKAASQAARVGGCDGIELVVPPGRDAAAAFCRETGFAEHGAMFGRSLRKTSKTN